MSNAGKVIQLNDGRVCILYDAQPMLKLNGKLVLNLVDGEYNHLIGQSGKDRVMLRDESEYNADCKKGLIKLLGYVD